MAWNKNAASELATVALKLGRAAKTLHKIECERALARARSAQAVHAHSQTLKMELTKLRDPNGK
jgi:hypothetical protein